MAVIAPLLTGIVVRTFAWMTLLSDRGVINTIAQWLGLAEKPLPLMYNEFGVIVGLVHIYVPFMVLTLAGVIGRIDESLEEAAMSLGASPVRAIAHMLGIPEKDGELFRRRAAVGEWTFRRQPQEPLECRAQARAWAAAHL